MAEYNPNIDIIFQKYKTLGMFINDTYDENKDLIIKSKTGPLKAQIEDGNDYTNGKNLIKTKNINDTYDENKFLIKTKNINDTYDENKFLIKTNTLGELLSKNQFTPERPFKTDIINATKQQAQQAINQQKATPGKVNTFLLEQEGLASFNDGINVINPLILTNAIPGEGLLATNISNNIRKSKDDVITTIDTGDVTKLSRSLAAANEQILGQEEGISLGSIRNIGDLISKGTDSLVNLFSNQVKKSNVILKATEASLEQRLDQNDYPSLKLTEEGIYNAVYGRKFISNRSLENISEGFSPIGNNSSQAQLLSEDNNSVITLEDGFNNNAFSDDSDFFVKDNDVKIFSKSQPGEDLNLKGTNITFPFYMRSLNTLKDESERTISFQATFAGLKEIYKPNWSPQSYFGRNTNPSIYSNTDHTLSFNFIIWSKNRFDLAIVKQRTNWLVKHCYPKYTNLPDNEKIKVISEGPALEITIGDIFKNITGVITNLDLDWDLEGNNRWELSDSGIMLQSVKVTLEFNVIFNKFMENVDVQNKNNISSLEIGSGDFYPAINKGNIIRKRIFLNIPKRF